MKKIFPLLFIFVICSLSAGVAGALYFSARPLVDFSVLERSSASRPTILLDDQGNEWARFELDRKDPVDLHTLPAHVTQAFVAAEDHAFFHHYGISWKGIVRSFLVNLYHQRIVQGASTITQQLVKLLYTDSKRTFSRKIKEQWLSLYVERQFSKEQILETYLNNVYFGCGIYGVQAASQRFWNKDATELTIGQAATLAAIVKSPGRYCPLLYPFSAQKRRDVVLRSMYQQKFISHETYQAERAQDIVLQEPDSSAIAPHCKETIRQWLEAEYGKEAVYGGGLVVRTTINRAAQIAAEKLFIAQIKKLRHDVNPTLDGGLMTIDVTTGAVKAVVGGYDFSSSKFNRAVQAKRQMGSVFKPLIYAIALEQGAHFYDTEVDEPLEIIQHGVVWAPRNNNRQFLGTMTLAQALSRSNNIIIIKTLLKVGYQRLLGITKKMNLSGSVQPLPSLALGCVDGTLKEVAGMFNIFANHGTFVAPYCIRQVKDCYGNILWNYTPHKESIFSARISGQVAKVMGIGMQRFFNRFDTSLKSIESIGKTGTTNDSRTCWFVGSTPQYTTGIYVGSDDNTPIGKDVYALSTAFPLWVALNESLPQPQRRFSYDPSLKELRIDPYTGQTVQSEAEEGISIFV